MASPVAIGRCRSSNLLDPPLKGKDDDDDVLATMITCSPPSGPENPAPKIKDACVDFLAAKSICVDLVAGIYKGPPYLDTTCPGQRFTEEEEEEIHTKWADRYLDLLEQFTEMRGKLESNENENATIPVWPLKVLPVTTNSCITGEYCYHNEYMTNNTSQTSRRIGYCGPRDMLQVFSLRLSRSESYPISVYGIFAVRDDLEPLRNYVFKRSRDDPAIIQQDSLALPLCSPCRGIYVLDYALLEVDIWIKGKGDRSTDEQILSVYVEIRLGCRFDKKLTGRIHSDHFMLDMGYMFLAHGIEAVIEVWALADHPDHVKFVAVSSCFDDEIMLFEGNNIQKEGKLVQHVVAVKAKGKLGVRLELKNSLFEWIFQDGTVGASSTPGGSILNQFLVLVTFAPKKLTCRLRYPVY